MKETHIAWCSGRWGVSDDKRCVLSYAAETSSFLGSTHTQRTETDETPEISPDSGWRRAYSATSDAEAILDLHPDCVVFTSIGETRPREAVADLAGSCESGANVVSSSMMNLIYPPAADPRPITKLAEACIEGGSTLFTSGIDPGFSGDALPMAALQICERVDDHPRAGDLRLRHAHRRFLDYPVRVRTGPRELPPRSCEPGVPTLFWGGMIAMLSHMLDVELEGLEEFCERWYTTESFDVPIGHIDKGQPRGGALRGRGHCRWRTALVRGARDPDAPRHGSRTGRSPLGATSVHRVVIEGLPSLTLDLSLRGDGLGGHDSTGLMATAMRLVNAIPAVVSAQPGIVTPLDLTLGVGRGLLAAEGSMPAVRAHGT